MSELSAGSVADGAPIPSLDATGGGKMFGVLVVEVPAGGLAFLRAFSGTIDGRFELPGFVPPVFDRDARLAVESTGERIVTGLTTKARAFSAMPEIARARAAAAELAVRQAEELRELRTQHAANRQQRRRQRAEAALPPADLHELDQQSRRDKAQRRALDSAHAAQRHAVEADLARFGRRAAAHARLHRMVSRRLMQQIHDTYRIANSRGEVRALRDLYMPSEPPGGAADCAAPKLLAYAYAHGLTPVAMAEFWWGAPPPGGGRVSGEFYPACREKCGPLLPFMLEGLTVEPPRRFEVPRHTGEMRVVFEDEWIVVVDKPCGLLSVPPRGDLAGDCVHARLRALYGDAVALVHRLDLDTSGLLVAARDAATHAALQRQFLRRTVEKRYVAIVEGEFPTGGGVIELPIRVDVNDRPRQIHDPVHGHAAITEWRVLGPSRVAFFPRTGRTHQLRVHAAHPLGLGTPIVGDRLYGHEAERLMLHAESLAFTHPATGKRITFESHAPF